MTSPASPSPSCKDARRKTLGQLTAEAQSHGLKRKLTALQLLLIGIGTTVGAGIYVMTGTAAAEYAGPSVLLSFVIAALACLFTALSYGELASTFPVSGSAYSYAYISMGEKVAWTVGWLLLLEYGISCTAVAAGLSGYATALLETLGVHVPDFLHHSTIQPVPGSDETALSFGWRFDAIGFGATMLITWLLVRGIEETARFNTIVVFIKVGVLLLFIFIGLKSINPANWHPFIPPSQGNFHFGLSGIFRAASIIFYAYVGFETVSTASSEARNPTRDIPIGIVGSLIVCTIIYVAVAAVLLGIVPYQKLDVADPIAVATRLMHKPWLAFIVNLGATIGLCSVLLGLMYGQSRVLLTIGRDRLIPKCFSQVHPRYRTPWIGTIIIGLLVGFMTAMMPIDIISELVSIGTAAAFGIVCFTVIWQRNKEPDTPRPFKVPLGGVRIKGVWIGVVPVLGIGFCGIMGIPLLASMIHSLLGGNPVPVLLLTFYCTLGFVTYTFYGRKHSTMAPENRETATLE